MTFRDRITDFRRVRAGDLLPNEKNWRLHSDSQREALSAALERIGYAGALIGRDTPEGTQLLDGHLRRDLDPEQQVPVLIVDLDDEEADLLLATYDPIGAMAEADRARLDELVAGLDDQGRELVSFLANSGGPPVIIEDEVPQVQQEPRTRSGDLWLLGEHRVLCGDAASAADHARVLGGATIDLVLTDPPYGVGIDYASTDDSEENVSEIMRNALPHLLRWPVCLITSGHRLLWKYPEPSWLLAWVHPAGMGSGPWGFTCLNPVLAYGKDPYLARQLGRRADVLVLAADREDVGGHPVVKPMAVWAWLLQRGSPAPGESVLDPFLGSGTTLIAAEQLGRRCFALEIEPRYVDVSIARWEAFTGQTAVLDSPADPS